jgi:hypothetical protein
MLVRRAIVVRLVREALQTALDAQTQDVSGAALEPVLVLGPDEFDPLAVTQGNEAPARWVRVGSPAVVRENLRAPSALSTAEPEHVRTQIPIDVVSSTRPVPTSAAALAQSCQASGALALDDMVDRVVQALAGITIESLGHFIAVDRVEDGTDALDLEDLSTRTVRVNASAMVRRLWE